MFTCGACGFSVTAERKRKPSGREYVYYHCTRVHHTPRCTQPSIEGAELERQILAFLDRISLPEPVGQWLAGLVAESKDDIAAARQEAAARYTRQTEGFKQQIANLTDLRVRELVSDEEFLVKRQQLQRSVAEAEERAQKAAEPPATFEPVLALQILCSRAKDWYPAADTRTKRRLLKILCSNPAIKDQKALLQARKPFVELAILANHSHLCGDVDNVRMTPPDAKSGSGDGLRDFAERDDVAALVAEAREFIEKTRF